MEVPNMNTMQSSVALEKDDALALLAKVAAASAVPDFSTTPMPIIEKENDVSAMNIEKLAVHVGKMKYVLRFGTDITNEKDEKQKTENISPQKKHKPKGNTVRKLE